MNSGTKQPRKLQYSSPLIVDRRRRLLHEARRMIAENGIENFSVRKLCQRAEVAQRTLYNAYQSKDRVIALAIREAFDEFNANIVYQTDPNTLSGVLDRTLAINRRNLRARNYTKAVCAIYFSPGTPADIWQTLQDMSLHPFVDWLNYLQRNEQIQPWLRIGQFANIMASHLYATINEWAVGRLDDNDYLSRIAEGMLLLLVGSTRGQTNDEAKQLLIEMNATGRVHEFPHPIRTTSDASTGVISNLVIR